MPHYVLNRHQIASLSVSLRGVKRAYIPRIVDSVLDELLSGLPAVLLVGPRACGKTTTASRRCAATLSLDRPAQASAAEADPDAVLRAYDEPLLIDEWQLVPQIMGAVKRAVDEDPRPGRFLLTGSSSADLTRAGWPATGRVVRAHLWGLSVRELLGRADATPFLSKLLAKGASNVGLPPDVPDVAGYVEAALLSGFPEAALQPTDRVRRAWLSGYVDQLVSRDVGSVGAPRDPVRLQRYLHAIAANTSGVVEHKTLYDAADVNRLTAVAYDSVLESTFVTDRVPGWKSGRLGRLVATPKRYLTDSALAVPLLGLDARGVLRDGDLLGRVMDTFVVAQLRAELSACQESPRLYHLREPHGRREIDVIAESADGRVVGIEVKSSSAPSAAMARHLVWLRGRIGERFCVGVVLHTGPHAFQLDDRIYALPICSLWA